MSPTEQMRQVMKRRATDARVLGRSCESLIGICAGVMADGILNDGEIRYLDLWLGENSDLAQTWPGEVIYARVREALRDGQITEEERLYLKDTLSQLIGGSTNETGAAFGCASTLPMDDVPGLQIVERSFCFTGAFLFGTRAACEKAVTVRGGVVGSGVTMELDYLVIGTMTSQDWAHTTFGRKIEKAVEYRSRGYKVRVIGENQWVQALE